MSTVSDKLSYLEETKSQIKQAIINKGVDVSDSDTFRSYAAKVGEIQGGDGKYIEEVDSPDSVHFSLKPSILSLISKLDLRDLVKAPGSNLTDLSETFYCYYNLQEVIFPEWLDTSKVSNFYGCFHNCNIQKIDVSKWDFSSAGYVAKASSKCLDTMFNSNYRLTEILFPDEVFPNKEGNNKYCSCVATFGYCSLLKNLDLSSWNTSNINNVENMFLGCGSLTNVIWGNNWLPNSSIASFSVQWCPLSHDSCLDLFNKLATRDNSPTLKLSTTTKGYMSEEEIAIATNKGWTVA